MALSYESTRGGQKGVTASQAILKGLAEDGGLFMPTEIPKLDKTLEQLAGMTYQETAYEVMKLFLTDYTEEELKSCIANAYDDKFDTEEIAPLAKADEEGRYPYSLGNIQTGQAVAGGYVHSRQPDEKENSSNHRQGRL